MWLLSLYSFLVFLQNFVNSEYFALNTSEYQQIYTTNTTFENPTIRLLEHPSPLDIIAIPTLPSLVPEIASRDFSAQLLPLLLQLRDAKAPVWQRAEGVYQEHVKPLRIVASPANATAVSFAQERLYALEEHNKASQSGCAFNIGRMYALPPFISPFVCVMV